MRLSGIPKMEKPFKQPSSKTLSVGAPTFFRESLVVADLQVGSFWEQTFNETSLKAGHYKIFVAVAR